jgi:hypothetical protein
MLNTRLDLAKSVAANLIALEKNVDGALVDHAKLQVALIEGRRRAKLPLHTGQEGLEQLASAASSLIAARKAIHEAHLVFRQVQDDMGLGTVSYGDYGDTPREMEPAGKLAIVHAA